MNLSAGRPEAALQAFEQGLAQDGRDVASLVLVGRVNAELGRLPQAKSAFDRALAVSPDDTDALCGELRLAQKQGRGRDAEATLRELKRSAKECPADSAPAVAAMAVAPAVAAAPAGRAR
jgi:cytochrome c-type biogenesis protein CcmH/NrfG